MVSGVVWLKLVNRSLPVRLCVTFSKNILQAKVACSMIQALTSATNGLLVDHRWRYWSLLHEGRRSSEYYPVSRLHRLYRHCLLDTLVTKNLQSLGFQLEIRFPHERSSSFAFLFLFINFVTRGSLCSEEFRFVVSKHFQKTFSTRPTIEC